MNVNAIHTRTAWSRYYPSSRRRKFPKMAKIVSKDWGTLQYRNHFHFIAPLKGWLIEKIPQRHVLPDLYSLMDVSWPIHFGLNSHISTLQVCSAASSLDMDFALQSIRIREIAFLPPFRTVRIKFDSESAHKKGHSNPETEAHIEVSSRQLYELLGQKTIDAVDPFLRERMREIAEKD